jgi:hypothetical protein
VDPRAVLDAVVKRKIPSLRRGTTLPLQATGCRNTPGATPNKLIRSVIGEDQRNREWFSFVCEHDCRSYCRRHFV